MPTPSIAQATKTGLSVDGGKPDEPGGQNDVGNRQHTASTAPVDDAADARTGERRDQQRH